MNALKTQVSLSSSFILVCSLEKKKEIHGAS